MYDDALSVTMSHFQKRHDKASDAMYVYAISVDTWRAVSRRAIPLVAPYFALTELCPMCTLRELESVFRDTVLARVNTYATGREVPAYDLTDAITAVLTESNH